MKPEVRYHTVISLKIMSSIATKNIFVRYKQWYVNVMVLHLLNRGDGLQEKRPKDDNERG